jgi:hypothetical protein
MGFGLPVAQSTRSAARVAALLRGVDAEQRAVGFVGEQVEQAIGALGMSRMRLRRSRRIPSRWSSSH